jgi:hypothetical protein
VKPRQAVSGGGRIGDGNKAKKGFDFMQMFVDTVRVFV